MSGSKDISQRSKDLAAALLDALQRPATEEELADIERDERRTTALLEAFYKRSCQKPDEEDVDPFDEMEAKMKAWGDPIAERLLREALAAGIGMPAGVSEADGREMISTLVAGLAALNMSDTLKLLMPKEAQEAGRGIVRFRRDALGDLCASVDGEPGLLGRMSVREMYMTEFANHGFPAPLPARAALHAEGAILEGRAFLSSFAYDAAASTPEEAVYVWQPAPEELAEVRAYRSQHDEAMQQIQARREMRGARIDAKLADAGQSLPTFIKDGLTDTDLALALDLLGARLETYLNDERCRDLIYLRPDGSVRIDPKGEVIVPPEDTLGWLNEAFAEAKPGGLPIKPADLLAWCRSCVQTLGTDLFEDLHACFVPEGMAVTFGPQRS